MTITERKQRWCDFYEGRQRTVILVEQDFGPAPFPGPENRETLFNWTLDKYHKQTDSLEWLDDDRIPYVTPRTGTEIFAAAFGSPVAYPQDNMPFALPAIHGAAEMGKIKKPKLEDSPSLMGVFEFAQGLNRAAPGALIQLPDIQSPLDIAALVWEKADFFMAMYDEPEAVKDLIAMTQTLLTEFLDLWFAAFGRECIAHYPDYYMPWGITLSEDEIGSISPDLFREFSFQSLCDLSARYGGRIGIHCCANAKHQWPELKQIPGLVMLNLVQPDHVIREASAYFRDGPGQIFNPDQNTCTDRRACVVLQVLSRSMPEALERLAGLKELAAQFSGV
jgi:hypothetical protein